MDIRIVAKPAANAVTDFTCFFFEAGKGYHGKDTKVPAPRADRAESISGGDSVRLTLNISAYRDYHIAEARRVAGGTALRYARKWGGSELVWRLDGNVPLHRFTELVSGLLLADYEFNDYRSGNRAPQNARRLTIVAGENLKAFKAELARLQAINNGVTIARNVANTPGNDLGPQELLARGKAVASEYGLTFKALSYKQIKDDGYAGLHWVGRGSRRDPALFTLSYKPKGVKSGVEPLCLLGKGVTFDTGGISIKPWDGMWDMKGDMSGAACVIGAVSAIAALELPIPVTAVVVTAENMPDGDAYRPGDILTYRNGKTVEIHSTDAEGRLILADGLIYAQETLGLRRIVEFSTLTGACARALGRQYIGGFSQNGELLDAVLSAGDDSGEPVWPLPMNPEYRAMLRSSCADMKNVGGALAGASTAAMFLQEFIEPGTEYCHLDIAGTMLADKVEKYWSQPGSTGPGVRLAIALAEQLATRTGPDTEN
jgi:leucyl aminopeptidase